MSYLKTRPGITAKTTLIISLLSFILFSWFPCTAFAEQKFTPQQFNDQSENQLILGNEVNRHPAPFSIPKRKGIYSRTDWQEAIDQTWGPGRPASEQTGMFNFFWNSIDQDYACFNNIVDPWYDFRDTYLPEVQAGVSKGRLAGMINHMILGLREFHTHCWNSEVSWTQFSHGLPLVNLWTRGWVYNIGAGLTPLPDKSLLVYKICQYNPLDLEPGDIVLGYDGVPWHELYPQLIEAELPISGAVGASPTAIEHDWLISAGINAHLFDTIDIVRHETGQQESLPTTLINFHGNNYPVWASEQMDVGVPMPGWDNQDMVSYGWIDRDGDRFGYIYNYGFAYDSEQDFLDAVQVMFNQSNLDGLIIDMRFNMGGNMYLSDAALALLFRSDVVTIGSAARHDDNHYSLVSTTIPENSAVIADPHTYWDKPLAILIGPGAISSGDQVALRLKTHPRAKMFGRPTSGAFNDPQNTPIPGFPEFSYSIASLETYFRQEDQYLTHTEFTDIEDVWHTQEAVIEGRDNVVDAAVAWMKSEIYNPNDIYVPQQQPNIQAAIDAVNPGAIIHLSDGIYSGPGNRDLNFHGKTAQLKSLNNDPAACVIDCQGSQTDPHGGFLINSGEESEMLIQGVTIRNAYSVSDGAGVVCEGTSPIFRKVIFETNTSDGSGGGIFLTAGSNAVLDSCSFVGNNAQIGGGVFSQDSSPDLINCTFWGNEALDGGGMATSGIIVPNVSYTIIGFSENGGAFHTDGQTVPQFIGCDIFANSGGDWTGGIADQLGVNANFSADPIFCDPSGANLGPDEFSPCLPFENPERPAGCGDHLIGAWNVGCFAEGFIEATPDILVNNTDSRGAAWVDYDLDGDPDLYLVNYNQPNRLYTNDGNGNFTDETPDLLSDSGPGNGAAWADFDNDGDPDLFLANDGYPSKLLRNEGGNVFTDVSSFLVNLEVMPSVSVSWVDFNNDSLVDLYVVNDGSPNCLYRNLGGVGGGNFIFIQESGLTICDPGNGFGASWGDFNNDGWQDLYLSNDGPNRLIENWGPVGFHLNTSNQLLNDENHGISSAWADHDNDGHLDIYVANSQTRDWLLNGFEGTFSLVQGPGLLDMDNSRGVTWVDFDNDGDQDIYLARFNQWDRYYLNTKFGFIPRTIGYSSKYSQALAWADYNGDGAMDLYISSERRNKLLQGIPRPQNHWLHLRLRGITSNASAIGARVRLVTGNKAQIREVTAGSGFMGQNSLEVEFGLGNYTVVDSLQIWWPSGVYQEGINLPVDQLMEIEEADGTTPVFMSGLSLEAGTNGVTISWLWGNPDHQGEFRLEAETNGTSREISFLYDSAGRFSALDSSIPGSGEVCYSLFRKHGENPWMLMASEKIEVGNIPLQTSLRGAYPNPFNPKTTISFAVGYPQRVQLEVFDLTGRRVAVIEDEIYQRGIHEASWMGSDDDGRAVASGTYFLRMESSENVETMKVVLVR